MARTSATRRLALNAEKVPDVGEKTPDFLVDTPSGRVSIHQLAAQAGTIVLLSLDSYRYHPG